MKSQIATSSWEGAGVERIASGITRFGYGRGVRRRNKEEAMSANASTCLLLSTHYSLVLLMRRMMQETGEMLPELGLGTSVRGLTSGRFRGYNPDRRQPQTVASGSRQDSLNQGG